MPSLNKILDAPKGLLAIVPTNLPIFNEVPAFSIEPKTFGTGSNLDHETTFNKNKTGGHFGDGFFYTHYAGQVSSWMNSLEKNSPQGVQTFTESELNLLVDNYIVGSAPANAKFIIVDFEPSNPTATGWMWEYDDANFQNAMNYIANRVFTIHNKYFYDWITLGVSFRYNNENYGLDGANNDGFANSSTSTNSATKLLQVHRNATAISNLKSGIVNQCGIGYTAITYNAYFDKDGVLLPTEWKGVENMVLKHICNISLKHKLEPNKKIIGYFWPLEDKPVGSNGAPGRRSNIYTKFKPNSTTGAYPQNLTGKVTYTDNRLPYPSNIVEDTVLYTLSYPNVIHTEYWLHGSSYNPYSQIRYSSVNGSANSCMGGSFRTGNYQGSENSLVCPSNLGDYIGTQAPLVSAFIKAPYRHAASDIKNILDGSQVKEFYPFQFKRHGSNTFVNNTFENSTGGSCVAALNSEPYLEVWRNPTTGSRVIYFWDLFADAFAPTEFKFTINGVEYTGTTVGNRLYVAVILGAGGSTSSTTSTTTANNVSPCNQGPTLLGITNATNTGLTFQFNGINVFSIKWRIMQGSTILRNGTVSPSSSSVNITYALLFADVYTFEIEGNSCASAVTSLPLTIFSSGSTSSTSSTSSTTTGGGGGGSTLGARKMVWNFGGGLDNNAYPVAKQYGIQVISYNNFYWNMVERGLNNFRYDELDYIIRKLKADGLKLILNLQPVAVRAGGNGFTLKDKLGDNFVENFYNGTSLAFLSDAHWDRDRFNNPVNFNSNLGNQVSFSYYNSFAMDRWEIFVARVTHYVVNHPFFNDVIEGFGILDGGLNETGFMLQADPDIPINQRGDAGYSDDEIAAFAAWLQTKYGTVTRLNSNWGTSFNTSFTIGQVINRSSLVANNRVPAIYDSGKLVDYKDNKGARDLMRFRLKKHRDFYTRTINIIKNPSSKIAGLASNTGIQVACYISENFTGGQGGTYAQFALKQMFDMFDIYFSSVTSGSGPTNTNSFLGDVALRAALFRGTFGQKAFGQEQDGDPVDANTGQSRTAKLTFDLGYKYSIVALQTNASQWDRTVTGIADSNGNTQRTYKEDVLLARNTFCNGQTPLFPATAGSITYTDTEAFSFYNDPGGAQGFNGNPNTPGKKTQWKNETAIDSNTNGIMSSNILLINTATLVNEPPEI